MPGIRENMNEWSDIIVPMTLLHLVFITISTRELQDSLMIKVKLVCVWAANQSDMHVRRQ